ncbi:hypothetical protein EPN87_04290 [archaeon]|nr:MAG: hypothetical protein EPN87_04290 [archaeon]
MPEDAGKPDEPAMPDTKETRLNEVKEFSKQILDKYGKYVKAIVMMGSVAREEFKPKSDIDIFVIIDDTAFEITPELHDQIDSEMEKIAQNISKNISVQPSYTLTEFWDYARIAHPIIYNFIKEGMPIYDAGFFAPIKRLLDMGRIPSTREAIESYMEGADKKIMRAKTVKLLMLAEDCYYAMLNTAQAVLMFMGIEPPVPNKAYSEVKRYLVEPGILEPEFAEWLNEIIEIRKKIEHKEMLEAQGAFVDEWLQKAEKFVDKMFNILGALEMRKKEKILERTHEVMVKAAITALKTVHNIKLQDENKADIDLNELQKQIEAKLGTSIESAFKKDFIDSKRVGTYYTDVWKKIESMKSAAAQKQLEKIPDKEVYEMREQVRNLIRDLARVLKDKEQEK